MDVRGWMGLSEESQIIRDGENDALNWFATDIEYVQFGGGQGPLCRGIFTHPRLKIERFSRGKPASSLYSLVCNTLSRQLLQPL